MVGVLMHQELVSIFFQTELLFPSLPGFRLGKDQIRKLYNKMFEAGQHSYENLELQGERPTLSTKRENGRSICQFGDSYIRIEEDQTGYNDDDFAGIVETVLRGMGDDFPALVFLQRCTIRCLFKPKHMDSIRLLAEKVANVYSTFPPLGRIPTYFGVRFGFLPMYIHLEEPNADESADESHPDAAGGMELALPARSDESPGDDAADQMIEAAMEEPLACDNAYMTLRFETYEKDPGLVLMEAAAEFRAFTDRNVFARDNIDTLAANIRETYRFLETRCPKFLAQFDHPLDDAGGEP